ncbi:MAG: YeeE/YedE thiosulfate transporter family protein [Phycisphaerales bacterium JB063]
MKWQCQLTRPAWSPYVVGVGIGVLSWVTFGFMDKALGTSTTMVRAAGAAEGLVAREHVESNAYFAKYLVSTADKINPVFEWQFALVVMLIAGAFLARKLGGVSAPAAVPPTWEAAFGPSKARRYLGAFVGGVLLLLGARLAGGCTSGHGISGGLQLAVSSYLFMAGMFASGIAAAMLLLRRRSGR